MVAPGDFKKKIKGKVGKRAPVKANVTDTSFKAAALHVSQQSSIQTPSSRGDAVVLTTTRGLSLSHLQQQLRHPAAAVRVSAVKGLHNILVVQGGDGDGQQLPQQQYWLPHLSQLIAALGPAATVDQDPSVRQAGLAALQELVRQLLGSSSSSQVQPTNNASSSSSSLLIPFAPYLMALIATSLNSLDASQCHDGAFMTEWLANRLDGTTLATALPQLIPPLTRLLSDSGVTAVPAAHGATSTMIMPVGSMRRNNNNNKNSKVQSTTTKTSSNKKRKRGRAGVLNKNAQSSKESSSPRQTALRAIHALLKAVTPPSGSSHDDEGDNSNKVKSTTAPSIPSPWAVIFARTERPERGVVAPIILSDLPTPFTDDEEAHATRSHDHHWTTTAPQSSWDRNSSASIPLFTLNIAESLDLLSKLRDGLVEATQSQNTEQCLLCAATARLLLQCITLTSSTTTDSTEEKRLVKFCCQMAKSLLEWFPLTNNNSATNSTNANEPYNNNADLCQSFMRLAATVQQSSGSGQHQKLEAKHWMAVVADHIQSCLEQDEENIIRGHTKSIDYTTSPALIRVLEEILMIPSDNRNGDSEHHDEALLRANLVELFGTVFFSPDLAPSQSRSATGRAAARMACRWFQTCDYNLFQAQQRYGLAVTDLLYGISQYLVHWRGDYMADSTAVLELLEHVVRRLPEDDVSRSESDKATAVSGGDGSLLVMSQLRTTVEQLVTTTATTNASILEEYPEELQRHAVCFLTMLASPSAITVHALGEICARCRLRRWDQDGVKRTERVVSGTVASFIVQCVHSIRKTMPMQVYIGFLVDSTGLLQLENAPIEHQTSMGDELLNDMDAGVAVIADCFVKCGTRKILPMLEALLSVLIKDTGDTTDAGMAGTLGAVIQARAAVAIVGMFSMDLSQCNSMNASVFEYLSEGFKTRMTDCIFKLLMLCSSDKRFTSLQTWLCPVIAVFSAEQSLLMQGFGSLLSPQLQGLAKSAQIQLFELWLKIVKHPTLVTVLERDSISMLAIAKELDKNCKDEPSARQVTGRMLAELEIVAEQNS